MACRGRVCVTRGANQAMREVSRVERVVRFVVGAAHVEDGEFLAAHGRDFEGHHGGGVNAGEDDAAAVARGADGGIDGVLLGGAIDGAIHAAVGGIGQDLAGVVDLGWVEGGVGAHVAGEFAAMGDGVYGPDAAGAGDLEAGDGEQSDRSGAEDGDGFAGLDARRTAWSAGRRRAVRQWWPVPGAGPAGWRCRLASGRLTNSRKKPGLPGVLRKRMLAQML